MTTTELMPTQDHTDVCAYADLLPERAVAALVGAHQVAIVRLVDGSVHCVGQFDPYCGANVMSRGLVGSTRVGSADGMDGTDVPTIQTPMYKQAFDVRTGLCVTEPEVGLGSWAVEVIDGRVVVGAMTRPPSGPAPSVEAEPALERAT